MKKYRWYVLMYLKGEGTLTAHNSVFVEAPSQGEAVNAALAGRRDSDMCVTGVDVFPA